MSAYMISIPHTLPIDEAHRRLVALCNDWRLSHGISVTWIGYRATFSGTISGLRFDGVEAIVGPDRVTITVDERKISVLVKAVAEAYIRRTVRDWLDPTRAV